MAQSHSCDRNTPALLRAARGYTQHLARGAAPKSADSRKAIQLVAGSIPAPLCGCANLATACKRAWTTGTGDNRKALAGSATKGARMDDRYTDDMRACDERNLEVSLDGACYLAIENGLSPLRVIEVLAGKIQEIAVNERERD